MNRDELFGPGSGNVLLNGLHEIELPEPPSYRPQTLGWLILLLIGLVAIVVWGYRQYRQWQANRYRRDALKRLIEIEQAIATSEPRSHALAQIPVLIKQSALSAFPRETVAQLSGESWLNFLDLSYGGQAFTQGAGRVLLQIAYQPPSVLEKISAETTADLIAVVRQWITEHQSELKTKHSIKEFSLVSKNA
ncbi:MAG: DUF4381 domain-containing protein [Chroococcidiopsidaceae cyanobacterium CP_BM_RX_35]|nr:DUF4381 domain-containing protein [Chroococcidiopsidaceae cyanobacterium CP_BM_RX_35]